MKYEYIVYYEHNLPLGASKLNILGADGWGLINLTHYMQDGVRVFHYVFKRPLPQA